MSHKRLDRTADKSNKTERSSDKKVRNTRITNSSRELNKNEEQTSPSGRNRASDQWNQMSQDRDRSSGRATPPTERPDLAARQWNQGTMETPEQHNRELHEGRKGYTGNSERTGQQYSETGNSSQIMDKDLKSRHPANDQHRSHQQDVTKRSQSANKGMKQQRSEIRQRDDAQRNQNELSEE